jgi:hypothetical protein
MESTGRGYGRRFGVRTAGAGSCFAAGARGYFAAAAASDTQTIAPLMVPASSLRAKGA